MEKKEEQPTQPLVQQTAPAAPAPAQPQPMEEDKKDPQVKEFDKGMPISGFCKKEFVDNLLQLGFKQSVAEKSLYLTGNQSVEKAMGWIEEHQADPDYEEELRIVGSTEEAPKKSTMSEEEARRKARELQELIRKRQREKEEQLEREREQERLKGGKALAEARAKLEEQNIIREAEKRRKEKIEAQMAMKAMEEQLLRDKEERFKKKYGDQWKQQMVAQEKTPLDKAKIALKMIKELYPEDKYPDVAHNCIAMLKAYIGNLIKDQTNEKFKKINKENKAFVERVSKTNGGISFLKAVGFVDKDKFLEIEKVDEKLLKDALALLP